MGEQLQPASLAAQLLQFDQRLRALEVASRVSIATVASVGLNRIRSAFIGSSSITSPSVYDTWTAGPVAAAWIDDQGTTGTGYPTVTLVTGSKVLILATCSPQWVAHGSTPVFGFSELMKFGVLVNSETSPSTSRVYNDPGPAFVRTPVILVTTRNDLTPGSNTFQFAAYFQTGSGTVAPQLEGETGLIIIPIN